jgi:dTDP-4-dehydrorhamnose reductase
LEGIRAKFAEVGVGLGDFVINCAGYTGKPNVDACEDDKAACLDANSVLPGRLRIICAEFGVPWGHVSSGCIFTGERPGGGGFREDDPPNFSFRQNNCSFYSGTKALGEETLGWREVRKADGSVKWEHEGDPGFYVWRLRIPFEGVPGPRNFLTKLLTYKRLLDARNSLSSLGDFVAACHSCWERRVPFGIYNVTNPGAITTREVVDYIRRSSVGKGRTFDFFDDEAEFMRIAARTPRSNTVLDTTKLASVGISMPSVETALDGALREYARRIGL